MLGSGAEWHKRSAVLHCWRNFGVPLAMAAMFCARVVCRAHGGFRELALVFSVQNGDGAASAPHRRHLNRARAGGRVLLSWCQAVGGGAQGGQGGRAFSHCVLLDDARAANSDSEFTAACHELKEAAEAASKQEGSWGRKKGKREEEESQDAVWGGKALKMEEDWGKKKVCKEED